MSGIAPSGIMPYGTAQILQKISAVWRPDRSSRLKTSPARSDRASDCSRRYPGCGYPGSYQRSKTSSALSPNSVKDARSKRGKPVAGPDAMRAAVQACVQQMVRSGCGYSAKPAPQPAWALRARTCLSGSMNTRSRSLVRVPLVSRSLHSGLPHMPPFFSRSVSV